MMDTIPATTDTDTNVYVYKNKKTIKDKVKAKDTNDTRKNTDSKELRVEDIKDMSIEELLTEAMKELQEIKRILGINKK